MRVSSNALSGEVRVSQEATLTIKRRAVAMETLCEGEHDVCVLVDLFSDVAVGDFSEGERDHALPNLEGLSDGVVSGSFTDLWGVVLYAGVKNRDEGLGPTRVEVTQKNKFKRRQKLRLIHKAPFSNIFKIKQTIKIIIFCRINNESHQLEHLITFKLKYTGNMLVPEGHLRLFPLQTLHGVSLPPQVGLQLRAELVRDATSRPVHRPGNGKTKFT